MDTLRLAVVSTPRSGNSWLRHMLAQALDLESLGAHRPEEVDWEDLPSRAILQLHWRPEEAFVSLLRRHGFSVIVLSRHPLDVLISILVFSQHEESTSQWLDGVAGDERCIVGASPQCEAFMDYTTGPRAKALLKVSAEWWQAPDVYRVRYEDLVGDTLRSLAAILTALGVSARKPLDEVVAKATPEEMRGLSVDMLYHVWQARGGLWKRFLTAREVRRIREAHQDVFRILDYPCEPDESLGSADAQVAWQRFDTAALKRNLSGVKKTLRNSDARRRHEHELLKSAFDTVGRQFVELERRRAADLETWDQQRAILARQRADLECQRAELEALARQFAALPMRQIRELGTLGTWSLGAAQKLHYWSGRFPRLGGGVKSMVSLWRWARFRSAPRTSEKVDRHGHGSIN